MYINCFVYLCLKVLIQYAEIIFNNYYKKNINPLRPIKITFLGVLHKKNYCMVFKFWNTVSKLKIWRINLMKNDYAFSLKIKNITYWLLRLKFENILQILTQSKDLIIFLCQTLCRLKTIIALFIKVNFFWV